MRLLKPRKHIHYFRIKRLYKEAFPLCERKPFGIIKAMAKKGKTDLWYLEDEDGFAGLCATINGPDVILIDYLAVARKRRGTGVGTRMLSALLEPYRDYGVFLEIEELDEAAENSKERVRRRDFYLRQGFVPMETFVNLFGVNMELLGVGCQLSFDEYREFYLKNYSKFAYDNIKKP